MDLKAENYIQLVAHYEKCFKRHGCAAKGADWPNEKDALTRYKIMTEIALYGQSNPSATLLDFGCGTGGYYRYLTATSPHQFIYTGLDLSPVLIQAAKKLHPEASFIQKDILKDKTPLPSFDFIIANGVFTEKGAMTQTEMLSFVQHILTRLFQSAKVGIAFNVMSFAVDWYREDLFHLPWAWIESWITRLLSRNIILRQDYHLYEYTCYIYK